MTNVPDTKDINAMCVPGYEVIARAKRIVDEQPRHSADSLRELLWREFKDAPDEEVERAVADALGGQSAMAAVEELESWVTNGCPGGPWKALGPLGVLRAHLKTTAA